MKNAPTLFAYLPREAAEALCKTASETENKTRSLKPLLAGALGMGAGTLAGAGALHLADKAHQHFKGRGLPRSTLWSAVPILAGGLGLAYNMAQAHQLEAMKHALENPDDHPGGRQ